MSVYVDDPAVGPARETSHPDFVATCDAPWYYDDEDERAPFGNPEGRTALRALERWYADNGPAADLAAATLGEWGERLGCPKQEALTVLRIADLGRFSVVTGRDAPTSVEEYDPADDQALLAHALGQFKITGRMQPQIRMIAMAALDRLEALTGPDVEWRDLLEQIRSDLTVH